MRRVKKCVCDRWTKAASERWGPPRWVPEISVWKNEKRARVLATTKKRMKMIIWIETRNSCWHITALGDIIQRCQHGTRTCELPVLHWLTTNTCNTRKYIEWAMMNSMKRAEIVQTTVNVLVGPLRVTLCLKRTTANGKILLWRPQ